MTVVTRFYMMETLIVGDSLQILLLILENFTSLFNFKKPKYCTVKELRKNKLAQ